MYDSYLNVQEIVHEQEHTDCVHEQDSLHSNGSVATVPTTITSIKHRHKKNYTTLNTTQYTTIIPITIIIYPE